MNYTFKMLAAAAFVALLAAASPARAVEENNSYGLVDMNVVMSKTDAAKALFDELDTKRKEYLAQLKKQDETLRSKREAILKEKDKLSKEDLQKKSAEFDKMLVDAQKMVQEREQTLGTALNNSKEKLRREAAAIVAAIAKEKGYATVFTQDAVIISAQGLDMTDEVVKRMNKDVKKIAVDWSGKK